MSKKDSQETRESPALDTEVQFSAEDAESVGDAAAAGTDAVGDDSAPVYGGDSPAAAQERAYGDETPFDRPEVQILGAFVGAFILAKLLQRLFSRR